MVFVTTADGSKGIEGISYAALKEDIRDANRELKKKLETVDVLGTGAAEESETGPAETGTVEADSPESKPAGPLTAPMDWTNAEGKEITAAVKSVEGENVIFLMSGREVTYPLAKLSPESREAIEKLLAE